MLIFQSTDMVFLQTDKVGLTCACFNKRFYAIIDILHYSTQQTEAAEAELAEVKYLTESKQKPVDSI